MTLYATGLSQDYIEELIPVKILRDTGASESFIVESVLPFSSTSSSCRSLLVRGIDLNTFVVPLHRIMLYSELVEGEVEMGIHTPLPVDCVHVILGKSYADGRVWQRNPVPVVATSPQLESESCSEEFPDVLAACTVTHSATRAMAEAKPVKVAAEKTRFALPNFPLKTSHEDLVKEQRASVSVFFV